MAIGRTIAELWRFNGFQNGSGPPSWILKNLIFTARSELRKVLLLVLSVTFCLYMKYLGNH